MNIPDGDKERFDLIIKYIKENKADYLDNIINYINMHKTKNNTRAFLRTYFPPNFNILIGVIMSI